MIIYIIIILIFIIIYNSDSNIEIQKYITDKYITNIEFINPNYNIQYVNNIITINNVIDNNIFNNIVNIFNNKSYDSKNGFIRKGSGISMLNLHQDSTYDLLLQLYYSNHFLNLLSHAVHKPIQRVTAADMNACSLLIYTKEGDYIDWHKDKSHYYGDRFVVLLTVINENETKTDLSSNIFKYKYNNKIYEYKMKPNSIIIFKGSEIEHMATPIHNNEKRILLSMTFGDICLQKNNIFNTVYDKIKNYFLYK